MAPIAIWKDESVAKVWFQPVPLMGDYLEGNCQIKAYMLPATWCLLVTTPNEWVLSWRNLMNKTWFETLKPMMSRRGWIA